MYYARPVRIFYTYIRISEGLKRLSRASKASVKSLSEVHSWASVAATCDTNIKVLNYYTKDDNVSTHLTKDYI